MSMLLKRSIFTALFWFLLSGCTGGNNDALFQEITPEAVEACFQPDEEVTVRTTSDGLDFVRTPDSCFDSLDNFNYAPNYVELDGLRMHYVDEGPEDGAVIMLLHGQPTWSYLYRKMIPVLVDAGHRVIAVDHIGMGRSDKPVEPTVHVYEQHVQWLRDFIDATELDDITLFVQDWGSLIGLRVAGDMPELFAGIVVANGNLPVIPDGFNPFMLPSFEIDESLDVSAEEFFTNRTGGPAELFQQWIDYAAGSPNLIAADVVEFANFGELSEAEKNSYNAPFPSLIYKAAIRAFPSMISGIESQNQPAFDALGEFNKPFLFLAGEFDPNLGSLANQERWIAHVPGARGQRHARFTAAHFIQDDVGEALASATAQFIEEGEQILAEQPEPNARFNARYCEVLLAFPEPPDRLRAQVWVSGPFGCPQADWEALDGEAIASEFGAANVIFNGPRFWVIDDILNNSPPATPMFENFGDLTMVLGATVLLADNTGGEERGYEINEVTRDTVFTYLAGREVYELTDPNGQRFRMQSFTRAIETDQLLGELASLGSRLNLPEGWTFTSRRLESDEELLTIDGIASVIVDDFGNTYQLVP